MRPLVYPVIHYLDHNTALHNAEVAFDAGCDGVFFIHMEGQDELLEPTALRAKEFWPEKRIGINYLNLPALEALRRNLVAGLDMTWTDNAGLNTLETPHKSDALAAVLRQAPGHEFFGAAAFKYQAHEPNPSGAAQRAQERGMIATTSGQATGVAADMSKIQCMSAAVGGKLAIASGITPDNVQEYAPYLSHVLVATGVSSDFHCLDYVLLCALMGKLNTTTANTEFRS